MTTVFSDAFHVTFDEIGLGSVLFLVSKQSCSTFGAVDAHGLVRVHDRSALGLGCQRGATKRPSKPDKRPTNSECCRCLPHSQPGKQEKGSMLKGS